MKIWVSSLAEVHNAVATARARHVVSLLSPEDAFPEFARLDGRRHHRVHLHDVCDEIDGCVAPSAEHVRGLIAFLDGWTPDEPLLVHCWAGISRSTAAAFIAACLHNPQADEMAIAITLRDASPTAFPNARIVALADAALGRQGRMAAAVAAIGPGEFSVEAAPFSIPARF